MFHVGDFSISFIPCILTPYRILLFKKCVSSCLTKVINIQESMAFMLQMVHLKADALREYEELESFFLEAGESPLSYFVSFSSISSSSFPLILLYPLNNGSVLPENPLPP